MALALKRQRLLGSSKTAPQPGGWGRHACLQRPIRRGFGPHALLHRFRRFIPSLLCIPVLQSNAQIDGLAAATFTPYSAADGSVDISCVDAHAADLAKHKVPYAFSE